MSGGDENDDAGYATRSSARTPGRGAPLTDANVNELAAPNSTAKLQSFKGR